MRGAGRLADRIERNSEVPLRAGRWTAGCGAVRSTSTRGIGAMADRISATVRR